VNGGPKHANKTLTPIAYSGSGRHNYTYRLELNTLLYEGVRYGFLTLTAPPPAPFTVSAVRVVAQTKPVSYTAGAFAASDGLMARMW
jgi:alpha-L-rhamnosidase